MRKRERLAQWLLPVLPFLLLVCATLVAIYHVRVYW
jgi:hypothetical protein